MKQSLTNAYYALRWKKIMLSIIDILLLFLIGFVLTAYSKPLKAWLTHAGNLISSTTAQQDQGLLSYFFGITGMKSTLLVLCLILLFEGISVLIVWLYLQGKLLTFLKTPTQQWWKTYPLATIYWGITWATLSILHRVGNGINSIGLRIQPDAVVINWNAIFIPLYLAVLWLWNWQSIHILIGKQLTMRQTIATLWTQPLKQIQTLSIAFILALIINLILKFIFNLFWLPTWTIGPYPLLWIVVAVILVFPALMFLRLFILEVIDAH